MKNLFSILLLLFALGVNAMHFTDVRSEKHKMEYKIQKTFDCQTDYAFVADTNSAYFAPVDLIKETFLQSTMLKLTKPDLPDVFQKWRLMQANRWNEDNGRIGEVSNNDGHRVKAPPRQ